MTKGDSDTTAEPATDEQPWQRNRRQRQAQIEAETEHGRSLVERYGREVPRLRQAVVGHVGMKRRRW